MNIQDILSQLGLKSDEWAQTKPGPRNEPETVQRQKELLQKVAGLIEAQIGRDHATVADLHERVSRLKHGGGV